MATKIRVTLDGDHARRVASFALWRIASVNVVGDHALSDGFYDRAWAGIHPAFMLAEDIGGAEHCLVRLAAVRTAARAINRAADGTRIDLPVSPEELDDALRDFLLAIDQNDELLAELPLDEQEDVARCRGAAAHMLWELGEQTRASALDPPDFAEPPRVYRAGPLHDDTIVRSY